MPRITQNERVLQYIKDFGSITQAEAFTELGVMRLASRVCDLERAGIRIERKTVHGKNRYGEPIHFTRYSLPE